MWRDLVIYSICVLLICIAILAIYKTDIKKKKALFVVCLILILAIVNGFGIFYIENLFYTFNSPENAFKYEHGYEVIEVVDGDETTLVVGRKDGAEVAQIYVKVDGGWKFPFMNNIDIGYYNIDELSILVWEYKNKGEKYIKVFHILNHEINVTDNNDSKFICYQNAASNGDEDYKKYYAYIGNTDENYILIVDGIEYKLAEIEENELFD